MRASLLCAAASLTAIAIPASPASALNPNSGQSSSAGKVTVHRSADFDVPWRGDHRFWRGRGNVDLVTYGGEWALYNNRTWESDSYNDWWHDRPERAYPRWMSNNQSCERLWWSGSGWRC